jgi:hypothetical protein
LSPAAFGTTPFVRLLQSGDTVTDIHR